MSTPFNDELIEDRIWLAIESSQNVADHLTYLMHFLMSGRHREKALDRVASLFHPGFSYFEHAYRDGFELVENLAETTDDPELKKSAWFNFAKMLHNGYGSSRDLTKAAKAYEHAISIGEVRSLINLGALYEKGAGVDQSLDRARGLFQQAIDLGESLGYLRLSDTLPEDALDKRNELLLNGAELDCPFAALRMGKLLVSGKGGFKKDPTQGIYWIERSANAGNGFGSFHMGWHYENGYGVKKDHELAVKWYERGVEQGDRAAMSGLAVLLYYGMGTKEDYDRSMFLFKRAAALGDVIAQRRYGRELIWGPLNSTSDSKLQAKGVAWLKLAEGGDDDRAAELLGRAYRRGLGVEPDLAKSFEYLLKAARAGVPEAQGQIGLNYWYGSGVEVNYDEAYKWLSICALQGQAEGLYYLGRATELGIGCEVNEKEAVRLYQKAAELGDSDAIYTLGECAYNGKGMECDPQQAVLFYRKAAAMGHSGAMIRLGVMLYDGEHVLTNYEEAANWFKDAAAQDDPRGMYLLGRMYEDGDGVAQSLEEARRWISKAAMLDYAAAKEWIEKNLPKTPEWLQQLTKG